MCEQTLSFLMIEDDLEYIECFGFICKEEGVNATFIQTDYGVNCHLYNHYDVIISNLDVI